MTKQAEIPVKYIFRRPRWVDNIYGTGLSFVNAEGAAQGLDGQQTRLMPEDLALKFLRHKDTFEVDAEYVPPGTPTKTPQQEVDEAVALREKEAEAERQRQQEIFDVHDQIDRMPSVPDLARYAAEKYTVTLDQAKPIDELRVEVKGLVDRFGVQ
jgi:hypothetical protein